MGPTSWLIGFHEIQRTEIVLSTTPSCSESNAVPYFCSIQYPQCQYTNRYRKQTQYNSVRSLYTVTSNVYNSCTNKKKSGKRVPIILSTLWKKKKKQYRREFQNIKLDFVKSLWGPKYFGAPQTFIKPRASRLQFATTTSIIRRCYSN